uniref:Uncharacterized protein n=1 Tax=Arion vulgaris TaxID=1028688 RepID=A0A0B6ZHA9_9EUPU
MKYLPVIQKRWRPTASGCSVDETSNFIQNKYCRNHLCKSTNMLWWMLATRCLTAVMAPYFFWNGNEEIITGDNTS